MAKIGGNFVMIMMLLSIIIYYYMNTFITLHQCTFNLRFALFFYTVSQKNTPDVFSYNSRKHCWIFIIFGRNVTEKVGYQTCYNFPPHIIDASALPCETENREVYLCHVNVLC